MYNTHDLNSFKYAQMQSSILNKSSGSNASFNSNKLNLKAKFSLIQSALNSIDHELRDLSTETKESLRLTSHLRVELGERELGQYSSVLNDQIKKLDKVVKYGISESEQRTERIWGDCKQKIATTQKLKYSMKKLTDRINRLQSTLGFYSASQSMI